MMCQPLARTTLENIYSANLALNAEVHIYITYVHLLSIRVSTCGRYYDSKKQQIFKENELQLLAAAVLPKQSF